MKYNPPRLIKHRASGIIRVKIRTPRGNQWISTGQTSYEKARDVCTQAMLDELQMAACASALTADVISRLTTGRRFTLEDIRAAWAQEAALDLAPDTFSAYDTTIRAWLAAQAIAKQPISGVKRWQIDRFVNEDGTVASTRRGRLTALRALYRFANNAGYCVGNVAARARVNVRDLFFDQLEGKETKPITPEEFERLMSSPRCTGFYRHATAFAYWLGWRFRDIACLEWASIKELTYVIFVRKTGRRLEINVGDELFGGGALGRIVMEILEQPQTDARFCFPEQRAMALDIRRRSGLSVTYQRILKRHGIVGKRFHGLRHACAMRLKGAGWMDQDVAMVLGHRSVEVTRRYTDHEPTRATHESGSA